MLDTSYIYSLIKFAKPFCLLFEKLPSLGKLVFVLLCLFVCLTIQLIAKQNGSDHLGLRACSLMDFTWPIYMEQDAYCFFGC